MIYFIQKEFLKLLRRKEVCRRYYIKNKSKITDTKKIWRSNNIQKIREIGRVYYHKNKEKLRDRKNPNKKDICKRYREKNKEKERIRHKIYNSKPENKERVRVNQRKYYKINAEKIKLRKRLWRKNNLEKAQKIKKRHKEKDPIKYAEKVNTNLRKKYNSNILFKICCVLRSNIRCALRNNYKTGKSLELLGCSVNEFKKHLESKFTTDMNWSNYGKTWEIDHIIPCTAWDLSNINAQKKCFNFSNQQPLDATENVKKYNNIDIQMITKMDKEARELLIGKWKIASDNLYLTN